MRITIFILIFSLFEIKSIPTLDSVIFYSSKKDSTTEICLVIPGSPFANTEILKIEKTLKKCENLLKEIITEFNFEENSHFFYHFICSIIAFQNGQVGPAGHALYKFFNCIKDDDAAQALNFSNTTEEVERQKITQKLEKNKQLKKAVLILFQELINLDTFIKNAIIPGVYFANSDNELDEKIESARKNIVNLYMNNPSNFDFINFVELLNAHHLKFKDSDVSLKYCKYIIRLVTEITTKKEDVRLNEILARFFFCSNRLTVGIRIIIEDLMKLRRRV